MESYHFPDYIITLTRGSLAAQYAGLFIIMSTLYILATKKDPVPIDIEEDVKVDKVEKKIDDEQQKVPDLIFHDPITTSTVEDACRDHHMLHDHLPNAASSCPFCREKEQEAVNVEHELRDVRARNILAEGEVATLKQALKILEEYMQGLSDENLKLNEQVAVLVRDAHQLNGKLKDSESNRVVIAQMLDDTAAERDTARAAYDDLQDSIRSTRSHNEELKRENEHMRCDQTMLRTDYNEAMTANDRLRDALCDAYRTQQSYTNWNLESIERASQKKALITFNRI